MRGRIVVTWSDGSKEEGYVLGKRVFRKDPKSGIVTVVQVGDDPDVAAGAFYAGGYPGLSWIAAGNYVGTESVDKQLCDKFHRDPISGESWSPEMTAWIAVDDKAPVQARLGDVLCRYSPAVPWNESVRPPPDVAEKMAEVAREDQALEALRGAGAGRVSP